MLIYLVLMGGSADVGGDNLSAIRAAMGLPAEK